MLPSAPELPPGQLQPKTADFPPLLQLLLPPSQPAPPRPSWLAAVTSVNPGVKAEEEVAKQAPGPFPLLPLLQHHTAKASQARLPYPSPLLPNCFVSMCKRLDEEDQETPRFISDPIRAPMEVPALCQAIIQTPQFDRLRSLR